MGSGIVDYFFRCDSFDFNFHLLVLCGFWPLKTKNKCWEALYSIYSFLCCFSIISMLFIQVLDLYLLRNEPINLTKNMCATTVTIGSIAKYLLVFYNADQVEKLHPALKGFINSVTDPEDLRITKKAYEEIRRTTRVFYGLAVPCILVWMIYPGLESSGEKSVPFPYRLPVDDWSTPIYEILYTYQSLAMVGYMVIILSNDLVFYGMVIKINAKYDMLIEKVKSLESIQVVNDDDEKSDEKLFTTLYDPEVIEQIREKLKECAMFHQQILEETTELHNIYSAQCLAHFLTAVTVVGVLIIDVVVISKGFKLQMLQRITYVANGVFDTFLLCYFITEMQERSYKLQLAIYSTRWYEYNPKIRQDILLILARSKKPSRVLAGNLFPINLSTFLHFLKLTYNVTALLYQTIKK